MANLVRTIPQLPLAVPSNDVGTLSRFTGNLIKQLYPEFYDHATRLNSALMKDGTEAMDAPLPQRSYTVALLPAASAWEGSTIYVSNESGGKTLAFSDGTNWRRVRDNVIVS